MLQVKKRNGSMQNWDSSKIERAITLAASRSKENVDVELLISYAESHASLDDVLHKGITVDQIHKIVENLLMRNGYLDTAREYITYRFSHMPDLFRERKVYRPFEYPHLHSYVDAIRQSYWTHDEFDFTSDVQDFNVKMTKEEKESARRCMLAIAHVEATIKTFWAKIGDRIPKPEIAEVGITFGESEVRHANAYAELLNILGLNDNFQAILEIPVFKDRQKYMEMALADKNGTNREFLKSVLFFSLFIENVSLFSQFLIVMMMNQKQQYLKGMSNVIASTGLEETAHAMFGADLVKEARKEHPDWFDEELNQEVVDLVQYSFKAEKAIIDWIFELGEIEAVSKDVVVEYIKNRYNKGLLDAGFKSYFEVNSDMLTETEFFDLQMVTTTHTDFFHKRSSNYTKKAAAFEEDTLF
jgi:ribonucleoside-diphosphate reductase beta chain